MDRLAAAAGEPLAEEALPVTGWHDSGDGDRPGWRTRAAYLEGDMVFSVGYVICRPCALGLVEWPNTDQRVRRCGLATAGLAALRADHPRLPWHTFSGHSGADAASVLGAVGGGVRGGYVQWQRDGSCERIRY
jgi:hypothetical protein